MNASLQIIVNQYSEADVEALLQANPENPFLRSTLFTSKQVAQSRNANLIARQGLELAMVTLQAQMDQLNQQAGFLDSAWQNQVVVLMGYSIRQNLGMMPQEDEPTGSEDTTPPSSPTSQLTTSIDIPMMPTTASDNDNDDDDSSSEDTPPISAPVSPEPME
ncbi:hypothetical protein EUX98_g6742, partial [Antrodiella citrinella]